MHVPFVRILATPDGGSRFVDDAMPLADGDFAPPAPPLGLGAVADASRTRFIGAPAGWDSPPHPAPARQWVVMIRGRVEATTSDGEARTFGPGDAVLVEDTTGAGHRTRVVGDDAWAAMVVVLALPGDARHPGAHDGSIPSSVLTPQADDGQGRRAAAKRADQ